MYPVHYPIKLVIVSLVFFLVTACSESDTSNTLSIPDQFIAALKANDVDTLVNISATPLDSYDQDWENTQDGIGFELKKRSLTRVEKQSDLPDFFTRFTTRVDIEGDDAIHIPVSKFKDFDNEFGDTVELWRGLETYLILRGTADVEHIVMIGIQPTSNKIQAIYTN